MSKRYEGATFLKVHEGMKVWERLRPKPDVVKLGGCVEVSLGKGKVAVYHLVTIDHHPRETGLNYDWYYLLYCRERGCNEDVVKEEDKWVLLPFTKWYNSIIKMLKG